MNFATVIVLLTSLTRTAMTVIREISLANASITGTGMADLANVCTTIIALDGEICDPAVPAHIKANLPVYEMQVTGLKQQLADLVNANMDSFSDPTKNILKSDLILQDLLMSDRKAR